MNTEELDHLFQIKTEYVKRLRLRELQMARLGSLCPPEVIIEVEELRSNISQIEDKILQENTSTLQSSSATSEYIEVRHNNRLVTIKALIQEKFEEILNNLDSMVTSQEELTSETSINGLDRDPKQDIFDIVTTPKKFASNAKSILEYITEQLGYFYQELPSDHISCVLSKRIQKNDQLIEINIQADFDTEENFGVLTMAIPDDIIRGKDVSFIYSLILRINSLLRIGSFAIDVDSEQITFRGVIPTGFVDMEFVSLMVRGFEKVNTALFPFIEKYTDKKIIRQLLISKELTDNSKTQPL